jgi:hypothetical protein
LNGTNCYSWKNVYFKLALLPQDASYSDTASSTVKIGFISKNSRNLKAAMLNTLGKAFALLHFKKFSIGSVIV